MSPPRGLVGTGRFGVRAQKAATGLMAAALIAAGLAAVAPGAVAALGTTVPATTSPAWQTNGEVRAVVAAGGKVYLGGAFTAVRPPGAASGTNETRRTYLAALDASTGGLVTSFSHSLNGIVRALATSPDGSTLYVGGDFTTVDGKPRSRLAAFTVATGALTTWAPVADGHVNALATSTTRVYVGGAFSHLAGVSTTWLGAVSTSAAAVPGFVGKGNNVVYGLALSTSYDKLFVAGAFSSYGGDATYHGAVSVSAATGATLPMPGISAVPATTSTCESVSKVVLTDDTRAYFGNEGTGHGCFDGTWAVNVSNGTLAWRAYCLGATQGMTLLKGRLYVGSHAHDCSAHLGDPDAFPEVGWSLGLSRHLLAYDASSGNVEAPPTPTRTAARGRASVRARWPATGARSSSLASSPR